MAQMQPPSSTPSPIMQGAIAQHLAKLQANDHHVLVTSTPQPSSPIKQSNKKYTSSLREWLNVLGVFLVPLMIGVYTITYNSQQGNIAEANHQADIQQQKSQAQAQLDQQRETVLDTYLHNMNDLIFSRGLRTSKSGDEVRVVARAQTLVALRQLDGTRKGIAMQFLFEAGLVTATSQSKPIISLLGADLREATLSGYPLSGADLRFTDLRYADLSTADLRYANLSGADLSGVTLNLADLGGADLRYATLIEANLIDDNLSGATLSGATFRDANLSGANLKSAHFSGANLIGARLSLTDLSGADLSGTNLIGADLRYATLSLTDLSGADLSRATISEADLSGANLSGAEITSQQLSSAKSLRGTILPNGSKHP